MEIKKVFENNKQWVKNKLALAPDYFTKLATGQSPEILYIGCSDSRVTAEDLMGLGPGEVFVHRNIANMVINLDISAASVIQYAVEVLKVNHVVICGHYQCGGVKAAMDSTDLGTLNPWLRNIRDVYRLHQEELDAIEEDAERYKKLVELNVREQCVNAIKSAPVQKSMRERDLEVHGWVFDISTGKLIDLELDFDQILEDIISIYHLD